MAESSRERLLKQFRELVGERLEKITRSVMALEGGPDAEMGKAAMRELHGLKGEARMMGFQEVNALVHQMEELVRSSEKKGYALTGGSTDALLVAADAVLALAGVSSPQGRPPEVEKLVDWLKARTAAETGEPPPQPAASPAAQPPPPAAPAAEVLTREPSGGAAPPRPEPAAAPADAAEPARPTSRPAQQRASEVKTDGVRIGVQTLDLVTTAVTNLSQVARRRELASGKRLLLARELAQIARVAEDLGPAGAEIAARLNRAKETAAELHRESKLLANEELRDLSLIAEEVQALRMLPLSVLFEPYPRMVRDLARELGKEVELTIEGEGVRADRTVVEALKDPLLHLVRNAMDHGLEGREARVERGKTPRGRLTLRAVREGERILLRVEDDGAGLDPAILRKAAVRKGMMDDAAAAALTDQAARDLIFVAGFSSKELTTDLSGRGVGLDVVRSRLQGLGGDVQVTSQVGSGTAFELRVPVSLTVAPLLFVQVGEDRLSLTAVHVQHALKVDKEQVHELAGRPAIRVSTDEVLPFASLASILGMAPERRPSEGELVLLVRGQGHTAAIAVDRVLEERVQAILPLRGVMGRFQHLSGATSLADGSLAMVLSAAHLVSAARGISQVRIVQSPKQHKELKRRRILVADDSPLTRELLCSLLEAVGYEVLSATDGADAFERLQREAVELLVTDLEMPRMDGLELTKRVKGHPTLKSLPVVIITTRGGAEDRKRGMDAGADGYIAKGDLARQDLVDVVARLLG